MTIAESQPSSFEKAAASCAPYPGSELTGIVYGGVNPETQERHMLGIYAVQVSEGDQTYTEEHVVRLPRTFPVEIIATEESNLIPAQSLESMLRERSGTSTRSWGEDVIRPERAAELGVRVAELVNNAVRWLGLADVSSVERKSAKETAMTFAGATRNVAVGTVEAIRSAGQHVDPKVRTTVARAAAVTVLGVGLLSVASHTEGSSATAPEKGVKTEQASLPNQKLLQFVYTPSRPTHLRAIAADLNMSQAEIDKLNPQWVGKEVPSGRHINTHVIAGVVETKEPVKARDVAKVFGLTDDAIAASNHVDDNGLIHGEVRLPGRVVYRADSVDAVALARQTQSEPKTVARMNEHALPGMVVVPAGDFVDETVNQQIWAVLASAEQTTTTSTSVAPTPSTTEATQSAAETAPTTTLGKETATSEAPTTTALEAPTTTAPVEAEKSPEQKAAELLNQSLESVNIMKETNDIAPVVGAVHIADAVFAPHDPDRRSDMPAGYVKALLPNELDGVIQLRVPAERTAGLERYYSAEAEATSRAWAKLMEELGQKYPQFAHAVLRIRDANSPIHRTHQHGQMFDISSNMNLNVTFTADGPFGDVNSPNYSFEYSKDLLNGLARLRIGDNPAIMRVVSSDRKLVNAVNSMLGMRFMSYDDKGEHHDHWHVIMNPKFNLPSWGLRARYLPWSTDQDLRIGAAAQPISLKQHKLVHGAFEDWVSDRLRKIAESTTTTIAPPSTTSSTTTTIPAPPTSEQSTTAAPEVQPDYSFIESLSITEAQKAFLRKIVPDGVQVARRYNLNPQVLIAQAAMESGYGRSKLTGATNNLFGIKVGSNWNGASLRARVGTQDKSYVATFRKYPSLEASIEDYAQVISSRPWYNDARAHPDDPRLYALGLIHELNPDGSIAKRQGQPGVQSYDVNPRYVDQVMAVIDTLHLNQLGNK